MATGKSPRRLDVPGEAEFAGKGVAYCATCDGPLFAGANVAVVGGGNSGVDAALQLMKICPNVYLIEIRPDLHADEVLRKIVRAAPNVEIINKSFVKEIGGDKFVNSLTVQNVDTRHTRELAVSGIFVQVGLIANGGVVEGLLTLNINGEIPVDCAGHTAVQGLFAAGDVTNVPEKQIVIAAGDGAKAALGAYAYLLQQPVPTDWATKMVGDAD